MPKKIEAVIVREVSRKDNSEKFFVHLDRIVFVCDGRENAEYTRRHLNDILNGFQDVHLLYDNKDIDAGDKVKVMDATSSLAGRTGWVVEKIKQAIVKFPDGTKKTFGDFSLRKEK